MIRFDLTDLRLFLHVCEAESITHGAERAGMALASASARIRGMEETGGVALLERLPRGVAPTPAGRALAHHARLVLGQMEQMRGEIGEYARGLRGHVRLLSNTGALADLPELIVGFLAAHPTVDIDLEERASPEIVAAVAAGHADIGILAGQGAAGDALQVFPFRPDRLVAAVPAGHALAGRAGVGFREVLEEPMIGLDHASALQAHLAGHAARLGRPMKLRVRLAGAEAVCRMVEGGVGLAVLPELAARRHAAAIRLVPLTDAWAARDLTLRVRDLAGLPAHARGLVEHLLGRGAAEAKADRQTSDPGPESASVGPANSRARPR